MRRGWRLRQGITLHPLPYGGAFVIDQDALALVEIGQSLTDLLTGDGGAHLAVDGGSPSRLAAEIRQGLTEGWLIEEG
jgi:hypothetical protein